MGLRVVGAGLGRTGTNSLKIALEQLLGAPCYHMLELFEHRERVPDWRRAAEGDMPDWDELLAGYAAAVDWPASAFWRELSEANPDALILLSVRDPEAWWRSAEQTIFHGLRNERPPESAEWHDMVLKLFASRFTERWDEREPAIAAFERHNAEVRATAPPDRLLEWWPEDGWTPICEALGVPVPDEPFPRTNTSEEWLVRRAESNR